MKNVYKKILTIALVAAIGSTIGACGKNNKTNNNTADDSSSASVDETVTVETLNAEEASKALKQNLTVQIDDQDSEEDATEANQDATEGDDSDSDNGNNNNDDNSGSNSSVVVEYVEVTNAQGEVQTDSNGVAETESVTKTNSSNGNNSGNGSNGNNSGSGTTVSNSDYVSKTSVAKTYWLDMTNEGDYVFDGEFLVATFKIKDTTPDGNYPVEITKADVANWDAETLDPELFNGYVTVGNAETPSVETPTDGTFSFSVDSVTAKAGDTIDVVFKINSNPGLVAFVFNFSFDSNALEYQGLSVGTDAEDIISLSE